ncbi:MAG: aspartate aminotransferase family protein [Chloroflexi bacterium]|nr:aspartate aminotransferase family protein [Chloroflexota bacterium]
MAITHQGAIDQQFEREFAGSCRLYQRARATIAGGITHDSRNLAPFPIYVTRAQGAHKWDVDGHELVDHWMGHGALLLGHNAEPIKAALAAQLELGTHYGACHEAEVEWAELITRLIPSAERVRFTMSGTEATMLALRDARAYTGKSKVIRFAAHFHGWHDYALVGYQPPFEVPASTGIPGEVARTMLIARSNDIDSVRRLLDQHQDVAAVILEPGGGSNGIIPPDPAFLRALRALTAERGVVLIFDEVITGFRYAPGGAQQRYGVIPDLTTLAKIVAGGLPGGAVAGKAAIMDVQVFKGVLEQDRFHRVLQQGTFNANPLSAAAGTAMLRVVAEGQATAQAERLGEQLRAELNAVLKRRGVAGLAYGEASVFQILLGEGIEEAVRRCDVERLMGGRGAVNTLRKALLLEGVDLMRSGGFTSTAHGDAELSRTVSAFDRALARVQAEGLA